MICANTLQHSTVNTAERIKCFMLGVLGLYGNVDILLLVCTTKNYLVGIITTTHIQPILPAL